MVPSSNIYRGCILHLLAFYLVCVCWGRGDCFHYWPPRTRHSVFCFCLRAAFKCWCQALDDIFRKPDVLHTWKEFGASLPSATNSSLPPGFKDYSEEFLSKLGIWGCVQGAMIAAKIAQ